MCKTEKKSGLRGIIAVNNLGYIGLNSGLPWQNNKKDFKHFKEITHDGILIVGYNTFQTLPSLKGRTIILDDNEKIYTDINIKTENNIWCIGGKHTYEKYCHLFVELHISHIHDNTIGDTMFPDFKNLNPECKIINYYF